MQDKELYRHLLGLESPWSVAEVELRDGMACSLSICQARLRKTPFGSCTFNSTGSVNNACRMTRSLPGPRSKVVVD